MNIVHLLWSMNLKDGGVVRALLDLCPLLASGGHRVTLLTSVDADVPETWKSQHAGDGVPRAVKLPMPGRSLRYSRGGMDLVIRELKDADVLHLHGMWMMCNDQVARRARRMGVPYVWSPHGMLDDWCMAQGALKKRAYLALGGSSNLARAAVVHCTAEAELQQAGKWFPRGRGMVVPLPFDLSEYQDLPGPELARSTFGLPGPSEPGHAPVLLFLSRIDRKKGLEPLIRASAALRDAGQPVGLLIAGGGDPAYVRSLQDLIDSLGLTQSARFVGFVTGRLKTSLYQAADAFVLPSSQENFGYVVVEAMAARTPVITTRGVALWPALERERAAVLVEPTSEGVAAAVQSLLSDRDSAASMADRGRAWCLQEFDPARVATGFNAMYERASARAGVAR